MRLWSISPSIIDSKGLTALWREGLLALNVLKGKTKGYKNHPQLLRFKECNNPVQALTDYLHFICDEADRRGYNYARQKLSTRSLTHNVEEICISAGQLLFEFNHLKNKIIARSPKSIGVLDGIEEVYEIPQHPMFVIYYVNHNVESWEKVK